MSLSPRKKSDHNLSANQFQEKLHTWLRDQGLLSELKSHLRMQMVSALQDGSPSINRQFSISPKIQALTVLIADFFLQQGYNFSLSVLTTEVPFIGQMFTHLSQSAVKEGLENGRLLAERFSARDVEDILETLGMPPGTRMHSEILSLYNNSENKDSLLVCIIRSLTFMNSDKSKVNERNTIQNPDHVEERNQSSASVDEVRNCCEHHAAESPDLWVQEMYRALAHNNFTLSQIDELQNRMRKIHEAEILRVKQEEAAKYSMLIEEKLKRQEEREEFFSEWQEKMRGEIEEKEEKLRVFANELISQHDEVKEKLAKLEAETQTMKEQEKALKEKMERSAKELEEKKSEMELEKADIESAYERLLLIRNKELAEQRAEKEKEREEEERMKEKREEEERSKEVANQLEGMNLIKWLQDQCSGLLQNGAHAQNRAEKEDKGLQTVLPTPENQKKDTQREDDEKAELRERVMRQRRRIEELTTRAADLANQLQDAQLMQPPLQLVNSPTIAAQPTVRLNPRPAWPPHTGSGEETSLSERLPNSVSRSTQASRFAGNVAATNTPAAPALPESGQNTVSATGNYSSAAGNLSRRRTRRIASRSSAAANNHSSDDSTTTEEMIEEARQRLRRLENESSEIRQSYQDFRLRLSQDIPPVLSHPEQDRSRNAFNYRSFSSAGQTMISAGRNMLARTNPRTKTVKLDSMLNIRPTYDLFQPRYSRLHNMIQNVSAWRQRPSDDDWVLDGDEYLDNSQRLFWQRPTLNSQLSTDDSQIIPDRPSFSRHNRSRPVSSLRKKMNDGKYLNPQQVETIAEKLDETSQEEQKETSGMESEGVIESMRNHELLCSEIDEKLSKRKEFLKKTSSSKDGKLREDSESVEKKRKSLTFNRTVAVFENDNEIWYDSKENSEDNDSNERTSLQGHTKLSSIPEQNQMVEDNNNDLQSVSGHSNTSSTSRGGGLKSSTESAGKIIDENTPTMKVNGDVLDVKDVKSTTFSDKIRELSDYGNAEEEELNHNSFTSLRSDRSSIEESQIPKKLSDNERIVVSENNLLRERSVIRQNSFQNSHPRTRSPSSLVSHFSNNNFGLNSSLSETANPRSPRKLNNQSDMSDRVPSFVLSPRKNVANSTANQNDESSSKANHVTSGEPDVLLADLEKRTGSNSVGSGEVSVASSKMKNCSNASVASSLQNRMTVTSPRIATVSAGDPWREPGDGIDYEKIDSDDPVSVGTQDSSSANSFW